MKWTSDNFESSVPKQFPSSQRTRNDSAIEHIKAHIPWILKGE